MLGPLTACTIVYFLSDLRTGANHWAIVAIVLALVHIISDSLFVLLAILLKRMYLRTLSVIVLIFLFCAFGGLFLNVQNCPKYFIWVEYVNVIRFSFQAMMINEFQGRPLQCLSPPLIAMPCSFQNGDDVLNSFGFANQLGITNCLLVLAGMGIFYRSLCFTILGLFPATAKRG